jgi:hypothetical protein
MQTFEVPDRIVLEGSERDPAPNGRVAASLVAGPA